MVSSEKPLMNKQAIYGVIATLFIVSDATGLVYQIRSGSLAATTGAIQL